MRNIEDLVSIIELEFNNKRLLAEKQELESYCYHFPDCEIETDGSDKCTCGLEQLMGE